MCVLDYLWLFWYLITCVCFGDCNLPDWCISWSTNANFVSQKTQIMHLSKIFPSLFNVHAYVSFYYYRYFCELWSIFILHYFNVTSIVPWSFNFIIFNFFFIFVCTFAMNGESGFSIWRTVVQLRFNSEIYFRYKSVYFLPTFAKKIILKWIYRDFTSFYCVNMVLFQLTFIIKTTFGSDNHYIIPAVSRTA